MVSAGVSELNYMRQVGCTVSMHVAGHESGKKPGRQAGRQAGTQARRHAAGQPVARRPSRRAAPSRQQIGWHYLSDATCLIRPHVFSMALLVECG